MTGMSIAQPDVTLLLDLEGVIRQVTLSSAVPEEGTEAWLGRPWDETVADEGGDAVRRMVEDARRVGVSGFRQVEQRFPSGLELPIEYTTVRLGGSAGLIAVGKSLSAVSELQSRLIAAQQAMERDYWKLREIETRYRLLFDASNEAVLLIRAADLRVVEANPAAIRALGLSPVGRELVAELAPQDREPFHAMLQQVREHGKAPGILVHLGRDRQACLVRVSQTPAEPGLAFLVQLAPVGATPPDPAGAEGPLSIDRLIERLPDGFVVLDREGVILRANQAFLDLVQVGAKGLVEGERLRRWLGRPGADLTMLLADIDQHGSVRLFPTAVHGELGTETEVDISAAGSAESLPGYIALMLRPAEQDPATQEPGGPPQPALDRAPSQIGRTPLRELVKSTAGVVERHYIEAALELTNGNRTAAAELLGLSRQSLYAKLNRYGLDGDAENPLESSA
jgi:transcriptional regulator PpsR